MYLFLMTINNTIVYKMIKLSLTAEQKKMKMLNLMIALFD